MVIKDFHFLAGNKRVLAAPPAKPALENWFGTNTCGPELFSSVYQFSLASLDGSRELPKPIIREGHLYTRTSSTLPRVYKEVKGGLLIFKKVTTSVGRQAQLVLKKGR